MPTDVLSQRGGGARISLDGVNGAGGKATREIRGPEAHVGTDIEHDRRLLAREFRDEAGA